MSAISEQLLQDILAEMQSQRQAAGGNGGDGGQKGKSLWTRAIGLLSALGNQAAAAAEGVIKLGSVASGGAAGLSEVVAILPRLPGALGVFSSALSLAASVVEKNLATQQELSKSGATFGGSLTDMRAAAAGAYLSLDQFSGVVKNNSDVFSTMGGSVRAGVEQFSKIQKILLKPGTETANMLATLGISSEEAASLTADYMRSQGSMNKQGLQDSKAVATAVANYAGELTVLSELTGKSRQAIQDKMKEEAGEAQWANAMAGMDADKAAKVNEGMRLASLQGQGAIDAFKAKMMGFPPMTEAGKLYVATQQAGNAALDKYVNIANNASVSTTEASKQNRAVLAKSIADGAGDMNKMRGVLMASGLSGNALSKTLAEAQQLQTKFMKDGKMLSEQEIAAKLAAMDADSKKTKSEASTAQDQQRAMQELTNTILAKMMPALNFLLGAFVKGADFLGKLLLPAFDAIDFKPVLEFFDNLITQIDWATVGKSLSKLFKTTFDVLSSIGATLGPFFIHITNILADMIPRLTPIIEDIGIIIARLTELIAPLLVPIIKGIELLLGGLTDIFGGLLKVLTGILTFNLGQIWTGIKTAFFGVVDVFHGIFKLIKDILVGPVRLLFNLLTNGKPEFEELKSKKTATPSKSESANTPSSEIPAADEKLIPTRASGGPVKKGVATLIGERGMELFLPPQDGQIVSNSELVNKSSKSESSSMPSPQVSAVQSDGIKSLQTEIQTLNKTMADVLRYIRDTAENTRQNVSATKSLDGNLFARP